MTFTRAFYQFPDDVTSRSGRGGYVGQVDSSITYEEVDGINSSPRKRHGVRLTFAPAAGSEAFSGVFTDADGNAFSWSFTAGAGDNTAAEVSAAAKIYFEGDTGSDEDSIRGYVYFTDNLDGTVDLYTYDTGADAAFTITGLVGNVSASTLSTAADADEIPFGRAVISCDPPTGGKFTTQQLRGTAQHVCLPNATAMPATAIRFTYGGTYTANEVIRVTGFIRTATGDLPVHATASHVSTEDGAWGALATALNTLHGTHLTATLTGASNRLDVVSDQAGVYIHLDAVMETSGSSQTVTKSITDGSNSNFFDRLIGISPRSNESDTRPVGAFSTGYAADLGLRIVKRGRVWVNVAAGTAAKGGKVYVSATTGAFAAQATSGYVEFPLSILRWDGPAINGRAPVIVNAR